MKRLIVGILVIVGVLVIVGIGFLTLAVVSVRQELAEEAQQRAALERRLAAEEAAADAAAARAEAQAQDRASLEQQVAELREQLARLQEEQTKLSNITAPPSPTSPTDYVALVEQQLAKLTQGEIAFNPPSTVKIGEMTRVEARIASQLGTPSLAVGLKGPGVPQVQSILAGNLMGAELSGDGFEIKELSNRAQVVEADKPSEWAWDIKGTKLGRQALHLRVWVRIVAPSLPEQLKDLPVLDRDVDVQLNPAYSVTQFWENNWQWVLGGGGVLASVAATAVTQLRAKSTHGPTGHSGPAKKQRRQGAAKY